MITWAAVFFLVAGVVALIRAFGLSEKSKVVFALARRSLAVIRNASMSDGDKEAELQRNSGLLFALFLKIALGGAAAVLLPFGMVWLASLSGLVSLESVLAASVSPVVLVLGCALAILALWPAGGSGRDENRYSRLDRFLHRLAFRTYATHLPLADLETRIFAGPLAACRSDRPVFITAMPRAGTTLLLECCARLPDFASHSYRDMPFVLTPCLWNRFSTAFRKESGAPHPRAHGDGMLIHLDSPEGLEEVLWTTFWKPHYRRDRIVPWGDEEMDPFAEFYRDHMRKVILLRRGAAAPEARYLAKNNGNIARTELLRRLFPDSVIVVPFREPIRHAASLREQHLNFLRIHEQDPFAADYMRAIGHFEFGRNLRPIDFGGWLDRRTSKNPQELAFWIEYWTASYGHLVEADAARLDFIDYDDFCERPEQGLRVLGELIGTRHPEALLASAASIRSGRTRDVAIDAVPPPLIEKANALYGRLKQAARNRA